MIFSLATPDDLCSIASFARTTYSDAFGEEIGEAQLSAHFEDNMSDAHFARMMQSDVFYLAVENEKLTGFVQMGSVDPTYQSHLQVFDPAGIEIRRLYVLATNQGKGIGSELIERALRNPMVDGIHAMYLTTWETNHGAQKLYRKYGFNKVGAIPEYGSDGKLDGFEHIMARTF